MKSRKFCPFCGKLDRPIAGTLHRHCPSCGESTYLNPAPAAGVALLRDGNVLLSLRAREPKKGEWDLVGGFMDANESPEQAIAREVLEETGCRLRDATVHGTGTGNYGGRPTLNFLFTGRIDGEPKASDDSAELKWWPLDHLPPIAWPHEAKFVRSLIVKR